MRGPLLTSFAAHYSVVVLTRGQVLDELDLLIARVVQGKAPAFNGCWAGGRHGGWFQGSKSPVILYGDLEPLAYLSDTPAA